MFTMAKIRDGSTYLDEHLTKNDYYAEGEKVTGRWIGKLAQNWEIAGDAINAGDEKFENLRNSLTVDGKEKLTQRSSQAGIKFFDWQLSARKSVSIMSLFDERIRYAHETAAASAFSELEKFAARRLKSQAGATIGAEPTGKMIAAQFTHDTSRALDPQLHTHFVCANVTEDASGQRYALNEILQCQAVDYLGRVYHARMAEALRVMGYSVDVVKQGKSVGYEIRGVDEATIQKFSRRRADIEAGIEAFQKERGYYPSAAQIAIITKETRGRKMTEISTPEVRRQQFALLGDEEKTKLENLAAAATGAADKREIFLDQEIEKAIEHVAERKSVFGAHEVAAVVLRENPDAGLDPAEVVNRIDQSGLVRIDAKGEAVMDVVTTKKNLWAEKDSIETINKGRGIFGKIIDSPVRIADTLSDDQAAVVRDVLELEDFAISLRGPAGAGKTTTLKEINHQLKLDGKKNVLFLAPTTGAVQVLREEGFTADTLSSALTKSKRPGAGIKAGSILFVDEAGLASVKQGHDLIKIAKATGSRIVFVGDTRQHSSVEAGDFLRIIEDHSQIKKTSLQEIWRQKGNEQYLEVAKLLAEGRRTEAFEKMDAMGTVVEAGQDYLDAAAKAFLEKGEARKDTVVVAPTHEEIDRVTASIRSGLKSEGALQNEREYDVVESFGWTKVQARTVRNLKPGMAVTYATGKRQGQSLLIDKIEEDRVLLNDGSALDMRSEFDVGRKREIQIAQGDRLLFRGNVKSLGIRNGEVAEVLSTDGGITVRKDGEILKLPGSFRSFSHGYAVTSHKSQGMTKDHVVLAAASTDGKAFYVGSTRGKKSLEVFCPDKAKMRASIERAGDRRAAADIVPLAKKREAVRAAVSPPPPQTNPRAVSGHAAHSRRVSAVRATAKAA